MIVIFFFSCTGLVHLPLLPLLPLSLYNDFKSSLKAILNAFYIFSRTFRYKKKSAELKN